MFNELKTNDIECFYYAETLQKHEPDTITIDTVKFILAQLERENKKVFVHKIGNTNNIAISWRHTQTDELNKGTSTIIIKERIK